MADRFSFPSGGPPLPRARPLAVFLFFLSFFFFFLTRPGQRWLIGPPPHPGLALVCFSHSSSFLSGSSGFSFFFLQSWNYQFFICKPINKHPSALNFTIASMDYYV